MNTQNYPVNNIKEGEYLNELHRIVNEQTEIIKIPSAWQMHLTKSDSRHADEKRVYLEAIYVLQALVQDSCPILQDENGQQKLYKPYPDHKLRHTHRQFARETGLSITQIRDALAYLESKGIIEIERVRSQEFDGERVGNLVYYSINLNQLEVIGNSATNVENESDEPKPTLPSFQKEVVQIRLRPVEELFSSATTTLLDSEEEAEMPNLFSTSSVIKQPQKANDEQKLDPKVLKEYLASNIPTNLVVYWNGYFHIVRVPPTTKQEAIKFIAELEEVASWWTVEEYQEELLRRKRIGQKMTSPKL